MNLKLTYLPMQINGKIWALLYFHFLKMVEAPMLPKILHPPKTGFQLQPLILRRIALVPTSNLIFLPLLLQDFH